MVSVALLGSGSCAARKHFILVHSLFNLQSPVRFTFLCEINFLSVRQVTGDCCGPTLSPTIHCSCRIESSLSPTNNAVLLIMANKCFIEIFINTV